jgi:hypothetical protein
MKRYLCNALSFSLYNLCYYSFHQVAIAHDRGGCCVMQQGFAEERFGFGSF